MGAPRKRQARKFTPPLTSDFAVSVGKGPLLSPLGSDRIPPNKFQAFASNPEKRFMKKTRSMLTALGTLITAGLLSQPGFAGQNQFYLKADLGGSRASDVQLHEFFGQPIAPGSKIKLDPGWRGGFCGGYGLTDWLDAEAEVGFTSYRIDSITGATRSDGALANVPFFLNARLHLPDTYHFSPYVGAGFGVSSTILTGDNVSIGGTIFDGTSADAVFAYQAFGGLRFALNERMGLRLEYHYFHGEKSSLSADVVVGVPSDRVKLGRTESHSVSIAFDFHF